MKTRKSGQNALIAVICIGVCFGISWLWFRGEPTQQAALKQRETATRMLGDYVGQAHPGEPVLVISNPFTQLRGRPPEIYRFDEMGVTGLRKGLPSGARMEVAVPELRPEVLENPGAVYVNPQTTTPLSFLMTENAFDDLSKKFPHCKIFVSLIGLPLRIQQSQIWTSDSGPKLALLLPDWSILGNRLAVLNAFKSGKIIAAVMNQPETPPSGNSKSPRFLLVTAENVEQLILQHPKLF